MGDENFCLNLGIRKECLDCYDACDKDCADYDSWNIRREKLNVYMKSVGRELNGR